MRYHFDMRHGSQFVADKDGAEFATFRDAQRELLSSVMEMGADSFKELQDDSIEVIVRDDARQVICTALLTMRVTNGAIGVAEIRLMCRRRRWNKKEPQLWGSFFSGL